MENNLKGLKVAIIHEYLLKLGGAEKVLDAFHELFPEAPVYTFLYDEAKTRQKYKGWDIRPSSLQRIPLLNTRPRLLLSRLAKTIEEFDLKEFDIVISNSNSFSHGVLTKPGTLSLCYCNSPMRFAWDWHHEYLRENNIGFGLRGLYVRDQLHKIRLWDKVSAERVNDWIANSGTVQKRILKYYQKSSEIIYPPVDLDEIKLNENIPDDYYVIVSRLEPYKKIELAIEAFNQNKKHLVIIGEGSHRKYLERLAKSNIEFLGWQSDKSVHEYIRSAKALIFPGEEDFGITPVEAMASGRPVIAFGKGGVTETVIEGKTGLFFYEESADSLNIALDKLEESYLDFTPINCRNRAEQFSKQTFLKKFQSHLETTYNNYHKISHDR